KVFQRLGFFTAPRLARSDKYCDPLIRLQFGQLINQRETLNDSGTQCFFFGKRQAVSGVQVDVYWPSPMACQLKNGSIDLYFALPMVFIILDLGQAYTEPGNVVLDAAAFNDLSHVVSDPGSRLCRGNGQDW